MTHGLLMGLRVGVKGRRELGTRTAKLTRVKTAGKLALNERLRTVRSIAAVVAATLLLVGCADGGYRWGWYVLLPLTPQGTANFTYLVSGFAQTLQLAVLAVALGIVIGLFLAIASRSHLRLLRAFVGTCVGVMRAIPTFVLLLWIYYALPVLTQSIPRGITELPGFYALTHLTPLTAAALTLGLSAGAFLSEMFRAGIESIPVGHTEAALSVGMTRSQAMRRIVLPQALRRMLPPTASQFIQTIKDSALASAIGFRELTRRASELQAHTYRPLEIFSFLALEYLTIVLALTYFSRWMERKIRVD